MQQKSQIAPTYGQAYARTMNQVLWNRLNGNTAIQLRVQDNGSNENYEQGSASTINGLVSDTDGNVTST
jgi:type VI protein secretion system component VasK